MMYFKPLLIPVTLFITLLSCFGGQAIAQKLQQKEKKLPEKLIQTEKLIRQQPKTAFVQVKSILNAALKTKDRYTVAICYEQIGKIFYTQAAYYQALDNYYKADNILKKDGYEDEIANNLNNIGQTYYYNRQYELALKTFNEALTIYKKLNNHKGIADSYGFIGQTHEKRGNFSEAFDYQQQALQQFKVSNDRTGLAKIYENLGSVYEDRLQLDSALKYFSLALNLNQTNGNNVAQIEIINNIGDVYRKTGKYQQALIQTRKAATLAKALNDPYQLASAYRDLAKTFDLLNNSDSAYYYSETGREIFTGIFSEDNKNQLLLLQTLFDIEKKDNAISKFENDRKNNRLLTIGAVFIIILLIALGATFMSRQRLKEGNLRGELQLKSKELTSHTLHIIQKNQLLEELKAKLNAMVKDDKRDQRKELKQLINLISINNNQDKNWEDFRIIFERVHENFFERLKKHSSSLTAADYRLVALLKMNLSSTDIATMLGISSNSLRISRYRLRKKLKLEEGENLITFIQSI